jgi:hypothetical protein
MQDRPTIIEMLKAVEQFMDADLMPHLTGSRQFYTRVATNVLRMVQRELAQEEAQLTAEWASLDELLGPVQQPATLTEMHAVMHQRNEELCERIRQSDADTGSYQAQVLAHLQRTVRDKLLVSNPGWLGETGKKEK